MRPTPMPRILLIGDPAPDDVRVPLEAAGFPVTAVPFSAIDPAEVAAAQIIILDVTARTTISAQALCRRWRIELGDHYVPVVWLCFDANPALMTGAMDSGADACLPRPFSPSYLLAQTKALLRIEHMYSRLSARAKESQQINQRLQQAYHQIDGDLEMARRIHRGFLPRTLPDVHQSRFAVCYRPRSRIGGDFYDVFRMDEDHVGIYMADAMGKGLPASSLLSIFIKKSLKSKEITGRSYRLVPPNEVLSSLNRELVSLGMAEPPFVTMLYIQMNCRDGTLTFSRASHPIPLFVPADGEITYWQASGPMLGVFDADYPAQNKQLRPGDKLLLCSDGVTPSETNGGDALLEAAKKYRSDLLPAFVNQVSRDLLELSRNTEDFTMLGIEYRGT